MTSQDRIKHITPETGGTLDAGINVIKDAPVVYFPLDKDTNDNMEIYIINNRDTGVSLYGNRDTDEAKTVKIRKINGITDHGLNPIRLEKTAYFYRYSKPTKTWVEFSSDINNPQIKKFMLNTTTVNPPVSGLFSMLKPPIVNPPIVNFPIVKPPEVGRYDAERRFGGDGVESTSSGLLYGVNLIKMPNIKKLWFNTKISPPIYQNIGYGIPKKLVINPGFKATLYYETGRKDTYGPEQGSFPSANKNEWKQFANPNKFPFAIVVVREGEPEPPSEMYIENTNEEVGRYDVERRFGKDGVESISSELLYGVNSVKISNMKKLWFNTKFSPPIYYNIGYGKTTKLVINPGFKATLYYETSNRKYRFRSEDSYVSLNKFDWKDFVNSDKFPFAIVVVREGEPEPPSEMYIE